MLAPVRSRRAVLGLVILLAFCVGSCIDYTIELDEGYRLARVSGGGSFVLVEPAERGATVLVGPSVVQYRDLDKVIVGRVAAPTDDPGRGYRTGYFLIDKENQEIKSGLSREEWQRHLGASGVHEAPELHRPNRLHAWF